MSTTLRIATLLMLIPGALWAGATLVYAVERINLWRRMPLEQYAVDFRRSVYRVDPLQPILGTLTMIGALLFALNASDKAALFAWLALGGLLVVMITSITIAEPMNSQFRKRPEGAVPPHAAALRDRWATFHKFRTAVGMVVLGCLVLAVTFA